MEKMIKVINDNLRTVISGIKKHKLATENTLEVINAKMDERIKLAGEYRLNVEDARLIISSLENEISTLENDLEELKNKFGSKDFKEILVVGSKEINNKIIEKKTLIAEQSHKIVALTDKAHRLKSELISLKERKIVFESALENDSILEAYYEGKILDMIEFAEEHVHDLGEYITVGPQETLLTSTSNVEDIDITSVIDGSVFEEIEEISNSTDDDELSIYLNDALEEGTIELDDFNIEDYNDDITISDEEDDAYFTREIDDIISEANSLLEISKTIEANIAESLGEQVPATDDEINLEIEDNSVTIDLNEVDEETTPVLSEEEEIINNYIEDEDESDASDDVLTLSLNSDDEDSEIDDAIVPIISDEIMDVEPYQPDGYEEEEIEEEHQEIPPTEIGAIGELRPSNEVVEDEISETDVIDEENMFEALAEFENSDDTVNDVYIDEDPLQKTAEIPINEDIINEIDTPVDESLDIPVYDIDQETPSSNDLMNEINEANLDISNFSEEDLEKLNQKYVKNNITSTVSIMRKHNIGTAKLYNSVNILTNLTAEELDYLLTLLEKTNASSDSISYVFNCLDKIDIYKLEDKLSNKTDFELTELLYDVIPYEGDIDIAELLDLTSAEYNVLKTSATKAEFEMINMFPEVVLANYNELKKFKVKNLNECITKHPHRFLFNPDNFASILDKYDPDDLTRCVNKNCAVIDKL